jgi:rubrerythrin
MYGLAVAVAAQEVMARTVLREMEAKQAVLARLPHDELPPLFVPLPRPAHRCPYCQTLILTIAAVRCPSCGAPR